MTLDCRPEVAPRHYPHLLDPAAHPDYTRRPVRVPTWETFAHQTQFTTLRSLTQTDWRADLERYTETFGLGRIVWPMAHFLWSPQVGEILEEIRGRGLYLFDLWSHVPGSPMYGMWSHITPPPGMVEHLRQVLGDRFLGMDNGEQDGRYVGVYAAQQCPTGRTRTEQYLNFQRHFQQLGDDLGNHLSTLVSLCFGHYFLKEGNHVFIGAETAQALPNSQVYYAFIRGAGKQYGVHWFGNASVFNRWGWKSYEADGTGGGTEANCGPTRGSSLSLLKRLLYTHYLYNCVAVGFETGWLRPRAPDERGADEYELTPIGLVQARAAEFVARHGQPGVMHAPVALLLDFAAGWSVPRHLYTGKVFQVWGALPYAAGDFLTHAVLSLLYPGYEDSSYYRDERGFLAPTPHGDMADCLLADAPSWVLAQYGLVVAAGALAMSAELRHKLQTFVAGGGRLVVTAANAADLLPGLQIHPSPERMPAGAAVVWADGTRTSEVHAFDLHACSLPGPAVRLAVVGERPVAVCVPHGQGAFVLLLSPFALNAEPLYHGRPRTGEEQPLSSPYVLLDHARRLLDAEFQAQQVFAVGEGVGYITCRQGPGRYLLGVYNNSLEERPLSIRPAHGGAAPIAELELDHSEEGAVGYWPEGRQDVRPGRNDQGHIAAGAIRLFQVELEPDPVRCLAQVRPLARPRGRWLALREGTSIQESILRRPTFFQHFDGVKVDWTYFLSRDLRQVERERGWLERQQVRIAADFSPGLNFYPDLTLVDAYPPRYAASQDRMAEALRKMAVLGAGDAILTLHRGPENHLSEPETRQGLLAGVRDLCGRPGHEGLRFHLQHHPWKGPQSEWRAADALAFIQETGLPNLRFAFNLGHWGLQAEPEPLPEILAAAGERLGLVLLSAPQRDGFDQAYDAHLPLHLAPVDLALLQPAAGVPWVLDAWYTGPDDEFLDGLLVWQDH